MGCFLLLSCAALLQISLAMNSTQPMNSSSDDSCKSYCQRITHPWKMKCIWNACSGCADCPLALPPPPPGAYPPAHPSIPPRKAHPAYPPFLPPWPTRPPLPPHKGLVSSCYAKSGKASLDCIRNAEARSSLSWVEEVEETVEKMEETVEKELAVLGTAVEEDLESLSPEIVAVCALPFHSHRIRSDRILIPSHPIPISHLTQIKTHPKFPPHLAAHLDRSCYRHLLRVPDVSLLAHHVLSANEHPQGAQRAAGACVCACGCARS